MSIPLVVIGAGGFGRETLDVVEAMNAAAEEPVYELVGVVDAAPSALSLDRLRQRGVQYLGTDSAWLAGGGEADYLIGIGNPGTRERIDAAWRAAGLTAATAVHPSAVIGSRAQIGAGSVICGGVQVSTNVSLGRHVHLNPNSTIGHDSKLGEYVSVNPAATLSGDVTVGRRALIGAAAVVLQGLAIGADAVVGASSCVVRAVGPRTTVKGVPAR